MSLGPFALLRYFEMAMVTPAWLLTPPTDSTTGWMPGGRKPLGICALICINPGNPGAGPAYSNVALYPAIVAEAFVVSDPCPVA